jgi:ankyrin repeat protein
VANRVLQRLGCFGSCGPGCLAGGVVALGVAWFVGTAAYRREVGNYPLYHAIAHGDTAEVRRLLADGTDPENRSWGGRAVRKEKAWTSEHVRQDYHTPLVLAVETGRPDVVRLLLDRGADVNRSERHGGRVGDRYRGPTALAAAVARGDLPMVRLLLARGARATDVTGGEELPVVCDAAEDGRAAIVEVLLTRGADANARCRQGRPVLAVARAAGHAPVVAVLRRAGARE